MGRRTRIGVVLAGGLGRRFGGDKARALRAGRTWAAAAAAVLEPLCERVLISARPGTDSPAPRYEMVRDEPPSGRGPLAGIVAAARVEPDAELLVLACDYPAVDRALLERLLQRAEEDDAAITLAIDDDDREHPLVALWRPEAIEQARVALDAGRRRVGAVVEAVASCRVRIAGSSAEARPLRNVNRREQEASAQDGATESRSSARVSASQKRETDEI